jgi:hypothetical protein
MKTKTTSIPTRDHLDYRGRRYSVNLGGRHLATTDTILGPDVILHAEEVEPIPGGLCLLGSTPEDDIEIKGDPAFLESMKIAIGTLSDAALKELRATLKKYSGASMTLNAGNGSARTGDLAAVNRASRATAAQMNDAAKKFWDDRARRNIWDADRSRPRLATTTTSLISEMNRAAREMWNQDPPHG